MTALEMVKLEERIINYFGESIWDEDCWSLGNVKDQSEFFHWLKDKKPKEYKLSIEAMEKYNEKTGNIAYENPKSIEELALGGELENWLYVFYTNFSILDTVTLDFYESYKEYLPDLRVYAEIIEQVYGSWMPHILYYEFLEERHPDIFDKFMVDFEDYYDEMVEGED